MKFVETILGKLSDLIRQNRFEELETEVLEIKPVPADGGQWRERQKSVNAFLNTRGGILLLGITGEGTGTSRRYQFSGWKEHAEPNLKEFPKLFTDRKGTVQDLSDCFPPMELREFEGGRIAVVYVDELAADRKFVFLKGTAYKRNLAGDHKISDTEVEAQEGFREEAAHARELQPVTGVTARQLDLTKLNHFIFLLNQPVLVETMKTDMVQAKAFLERRFFLRDEVVTVLGALVCAEHPGDCLGFRCHVHGYVDLPRQNTESDSVSQVVQDKQDFVDNVLQLMELSYGYLLRNIQVGVSVREAGKSQPQYPDTLLRETVNNALAHRDYSIDRQVILVVTPGKHISIQNPGRFSPPLLIEAPNDPVPLHRILPEARPRNPKLADVLRVYRKWEGRGIGMATLVNLCLQNQMDLPYYRLRSDEVSLYLCAGRLLDDHMERLFQSFDGYIEVQLQGNSLTNEQKMVLAYLIKSETANEKLGYTILLTPDNNHFAALLGLERAGLIEKHRLSSANYPIYIANRLLMSRGYIPELRQLFGSGFDSLDPLLKQILGVVYRFNTFSKERAVSAKRASFALWYEGDGGSGTIEQFDTFYRKVRYAFNKLEKAGYMERNEGPRYQLNRGYLATHLF